MIFFFFFFGGGGWLPSFFRDNVSDRNPAFLEFSTISRECSNDDSLRSILANKVENCANHILLPDSMDRKIVCI